MEVHVELRARNTLKAAERGDVLVIIDVLRCSSTIVTALVNGASEIIPVSTVKQAKQMKLQRPSYILAGERKGLKPEGFELGNSPREFTHRKVNGRAIILTTTDGTLAFGFAKGAREVLVGSFLNAEAVGKRVCKTACRENCGISLVACGKGGEFSIEDFLCAGRILETVPDEELALSDGAIAALLASNGAGERISEWVHSGEHGRALEEIELVDDIGFCLRVNRYSAVPVLSDGKVALQSH